MYENQTVVHELHPRLLGYPLFRFPMWTGCTAGGCQSTSMCTQTGCCHDIPPACHTNNYPLGGAARVYRTARVFATTDWTSTWVSHDATLSLYKVNTRRRTPTEHPSLFSEMQNANMSRRLPDCYSLSTTVDPVLETCSLRSAPSTQRP